MVSRSTGTVLRPAPEGGAVLRLSSCQAPNSEHIKEAVCRHQTDHCGLRVEFVADGHWEQRYADLEAGRLDAAWVCGAWYLRLLKSGSGATPLVAPVWRGPRYAGRPVYFSDVVVRSDSAYRTFEDLRGRRFAINEPGSYSGHGCVGVELSRRQETAGYFSTVTVSGSHEASLELVLGDDVDAAAIDTTVLEQQLRRVPILRDRLRRVLTLGPAAMPPIVASSALHPERQHQLRETLTQLHTTPEGQALLGALPVARFAPVDDADYASMRQLLATAVLLAFEADHDHAAP
jgi:phosphonate transport system substrate-binding protein